MSPPSAPAALQHRCSIPKLPRLQSSVYSLPLRPWLPAQVHLQEPRAPAHPEVSAGAAWGSRGAQEQSTTEGLGRNFLPVLGCSMIGQAQVICCVGSTRVGICHCRWIGLTVHPRFLGHLPCTRENLALSRPASPHPTQVCPCSAASGQRLGQDPSVSVKFQQGLGYPSPATHWPAGLGHHELPAVQRKGALGAAALEQPAT